MSRKGKSGTESDSDIEFLSKKLQNLKVANEKCDINILLLGETGVGKSTFINAFFNYLQYPTLKQAKQGKFVTLIPAKFTITDENYEERVVQVGEDINEKIEVGVSATQECRSYVYPIENGRCRIRIIDTPGIGDTRGINQDNVNFENILSFIGEMKQLNAICILLKPNNSRLTVMFEFCIKQLLSRLEKSASNNLIFVFTNTRSTFYRPGETMPALKKLLGTIKGVDIPLSKENIICTDNEAFRFLAAVNNGIRFSTIDVDNFAQSWLKSVEECWRMITYIAGDSNRVALVPHEVKNTVSVNEARRLIVQLSQPLADIAQLIHDNIRVLEKHKQSLHQSNITLKELKTKLFIPTVNLRVIPMDKPTTVCTSPKCSKLYKVGDRQKWHYHQKCHDPCYLKNVPKEIVGSPELASCSSMKGEGICSKCSCRFQVHMHIYYQTETYDDRMEDTSIKSAITDKEIGLIQAKNLIIKISRRVDEYYKEREIIIKTTAKFACFLKTNAITPYNDAYHAYLEYLIDRERSMGDVADYDMINQFKKMLAEYNEEKNTLLTAMNQNTSNMKHVTADDIISSVQTLYNLKHNGEKIRELFSIQKRARKDENQSEAKEYIYHHSTAGKAKGKQYNKEKKKMAKNVSNAEPRQYRHRRQNRNFPNQQLQNQNNSSYSSQYRDNHTQPHPMSDVNLNQHIHINQDGSGFDIRFRQTDRSIRPQNPIPNYSGPSHYTPPHVQHYYPRPNLNRNPSYDPPPYNQVPPPSSYYHQQRSSNYPASPPPSYNRQPHLTPHQHPNFHPQYENRPQPLMGENLERPYREPQNCQPNQRQQCFNQRPHKQKDNASKPRHFQKGKDAAKNERAYNSEPEYAKGGKNKRANKNPSTKNSRRHNLDSSSDSDDSQYFSSTNDRRQH